MYWLSKDGCTSDTAMFTVNVIGGPVAVDDFVAINSGTTEIGIDILGNDEITSNVNPSVRAVTQPNDGTITFDEPTQTFLFAVDDLGLKRSNFDRLLAGSMDVAKLDRRWLENPVVLDSLIRYLGYMN